MHRQDLPSKLHLNGGTAGMEYWVLAVAITPLLHYSASAALRKRSGLGRSLAPPSWARSDFGFRVSFGLRVSAFGLLLRFHLLRPLVEALILAHMADAGLARNFQKMVQ